MTKRRFCFTLFLLICFSLPVTATAQTVNIPDPNLRAKIRDALGKTSGEAITTADMETLTDFNAQEANITDLTGLEHATNLTILFLNQNSISDISPVAKLTELVILRLSQNSISDISPIAKLTELVILQLSQNSISDISPIAKLTNLRLLWLDNNFISDISPVAKLTNLTLLWLDFNSVSDISPVAKLTNLTDLALRDNSISDISPIAKLTNLIDLFLNNNSISDISPVVGLTNLTRLWLNKNSISDISPLVENTGLGQNDTVAVRGNPLNDAAIITHIPALENRGVTVLFDKTVNIPDPNLRAKIENALGKSSGEAITKQEILLTLTELNAQEANITDLTGLEYASNLTELSLNQNSITSISPVANLTNLTELWLDTNSISDISPVANLTNLTILSLNDNSISDIAPVANLNKLTHLFLNDNSISDIAPVANLNKLTHLFLNDNSISDISPVSRLTNLTRLWLNKNNISDISPVAKLTNLTELALRDNSISDISPLVENTGLDDVDVWGNPLNDAAFITHIPELENRAVAVQFDDTVNIPDLNFRAKIENALGKTSGEAITRQDMADLPRFNAQDANITDLTGLEHASNLTHLWFNNNSISDISPVAKLTKLTNLSLNDNPISDISAVASLTYMTTLSLDNNTISDISAVAHLPLLKNLSLKDNNISDISGLVSLLSLRKLSLDNNTISDISAVARLTDLNDLSLDKNAVSDISALAGLTYLTSLSLNNNDISDISSLVSNTGLGQNDVVDVRGNPLNDAAIITHIPALQNRGVEILFDNRVVKTEDTAQTVNIPDPKLRAKIETALGKTSGQTISTADMLTLSRLDAEESNIADLTGLEHATNLTILRLNNNDIADISSLVANTGLGDGDNISLYTNPLSYQSIYTHIPALQERGIEVGFDNRTPQRIRIVSGDDQQGLPGAALEKPFVVEVEDQNGVAFQGVPVTFAVTGGDGTLSTTSTATDANGRAESTLTLSSTPGSNTVRVSVEGNTQTVAVLTIESARIPTFTLSIPKGMHIVHIPLAVNQINGEDRTIETVGDLFNALGDAVRFIISIGVDGNWTSYFGEENAGSMADAPIKDDMGLIAAMKETKTLELMGDSLGTAGTAQITLLSGNNLVGVPLQPAEGFNMISDLLVDGVGAITVSKADGKGFHTIREPGAEGDGPIVGGVGYLVVYLESEPTIISIIGSAWKDE
ncbi:MAG: leucine-rich repeat domain-containing protein [Candidatus Poribacteria bacterium]|nr:leucine-rich repeat domain-containing protein [Candidatus Poribacteria bacterium]